MQENASAASREPGVATAEKPDSGQARGNVFAAQNVIDKIRQSGNRTTMQKLPVVVRDKAFWVLGLLGLAYFSAPLAFGKTFFFRDLYLHFFFRKQLLAEFLRSGRLPLWNEFLHGGRPYWGDLSNAALHPSNLLYLGLPTLTAFNVIIVFHFLLAGAAMYGLARSLGLKPPASFLAGVIFEFCGYTLSLGNMLGFLLALPYLPLLVLGWHRWLLTDRRRWLLLALVSGMIQVFAGAPELCALCLALLFGWTVSVPYPRLTVLRRAVRCLGFGACLLGLTAIQLVPTIETIARSSRGAGLPYQAFAQWSLHPKRTAEFIFPGLSGFLDQFPWGEFYWGKHLVDLEYPYIISLYFGAVTLALAGLALRRSAPSTAARALPLAARRMLGALALGALLLAFGRFLPGFRLLHAHAPLIGLFRYPVKFLLAAIFPVALLAAFTVDAVLSEPGAARIPTRLIRAAAALAALLLALAALFRFSDGFADVAIAAWFGAVNTAIARQGINQALAHAAAIWTLLTVFLSAARRGFHAWQPWALAALVAGDLLLAGLRVNPHAPGDFFSAVPDAVPPIHQIRGDGRLYRTKNPGPIELPNLPSSDIFWGDRWNLETLNSALAAIYGIPLVFHVDYDRLAHHHVAILGELLDSLPWERRLPILSAGNVTTILTPDRIAAPGIEFVGVIPNRSATPFYLYHNTNAARRIEFVALWQQAASDRDALGALLAPDYDPRARVVLQEPFETSWFAAVTSKPSSSPGPIRIGPPPDAEQLRGTGCRAAAITPLSRTLTHEALAVDAACDGYLVFATPWYPGWRVTVDGVDAPIARANYAFSAVFLTAGAHRVERRYVPVSVIVGGGISLLFCGLVAAVMFRRKKT